MKNTKTRQRTSPVHMFAIPRTPDSILRQPVRLNRTAPQWSEPETTRTAVTKSRAYWKACRQLAKLTVPEFRSHLASGFRHLPVDDTGRSQLCKLLKSAPDDSLFWDAVEGADKAIQEAERKGAPQNTDQASVAWSFIGEDYIWKGQYFRDRFAEKSAVISRQWTENGLEVLTYLHLLRAVGDLPVRERSRNVRFFWERGKNYGLLAAIQEELPAPWVGDAVAKVKRRVSEGDTPEIRRRAQARLKKIDQAQNAIGKGNVKILSPEEKMKSKRLSVSNSRALHRLLNKHKLQTRFYGDAEKTAEAIADDFREDGRIQNRGRREKIATQFLKRVRQQENLR